jgi:hypothetical protein
MIKKLRNHPYAPQSGSKEEEEKEKNAHLLFETGCIVTCVVNPMEENTRVRMFEFPTTV